MGKRPLRTCRLAFVVPVEPDQDAPQDDEGAGLVGRVALDEHVLAPVSGQAIGGEVHAGAAAVLFREVEINWRFVPAERGLHVLDEGPGHSPYCADVPFILSRAGRRAVPRLS